MELPADVWQGVFAALPTWAALAACRVVCAAWARRLDSPHTRGAWLALMPKTPTACLVKATKKAIHLDSIRWCVRTFEIRAYGADHYLNINPVLEHLGSRGELDSMRWLIEELKPASFGFDVLVEACMSGDTKLVAWLSDLYDSRAAVVNGGRLLHAASHGGNPALVRWVADRYGVTAMDASDGMYSALEAACDTGSLEVVRLLIDKYGWEVWEASGGAAHALIKACAHGSHEIVELIWYYGGPFGKSEHIPAFHAACANGHLDLAKTLSQLFGITEAHVLDHTFDVVCAQGLLDMAKWLAAEFGLARDDVQPMFKTENARVGSSDILGRYGRLEVARWLTHTYRLTRDDIDLRATVNAASRNGHLEFVRWLDEAYGLTDDDKGSAALAACAGGHLALANRLAVRGHCGDVAAVKAALSVAVGQGKLGCVEWLVDQHINVIATTEASALLKTACMRGHRDVAVYLEREFELAGTSAGNIYVRGVDMLLAASTGGNLDLAEWVITIFGLPYGTVHTNAGYLLQQLCKKGCFNAAKRLAAQYGPIIVRPGWSDALHAACGNGHYEIADWLIDTFGLTGADAAASRHRDSYGPWLRARLGLPPT